MTQIEGRPIELGELFVERYRIERVLGTGGMGKVFLAKDTMLDNEVLALKILHHELCGDERQTKRFLREAQLTRKITHPNVVRTFDAGSVGESYYMTMEYVDGVTLRDKLQHGPVNTSEAASIIKQACEGLSAIHAHQIIHRDLKPGNILLTNDGRVKITDFGVARPGMSDLTQHNEVVGSSAYMAPEVWIGKKIGPQADIYALGIVWYEMLTGALPFEGDAPAELMCKHLDSNPYPPRSLLSSIPTWANNLVLKMLAKDPADRPQSVEEIVSIIEQRALNVTNSSSDLVVDQGFLASLSAASAAETPPAQVLAPKEHEGASGPSSARISSTQLARSQGLVRGDTHSVRVKHAPARDAINARTQLAANRRPSAMTLKSSMEQPSLGFIRRKLAQSAVIGATMSLAWYVVAHLLGSIAYNLINSIATVNSGVTAICVFALAIFCVAGTTAIPATLLCFAGRAVWSAPRMWFSVTQFSMALCVGVSALHFFHIAGDRGATGVIGLLNTVTAIERGSTNLVQSLLLAPHNEILSGGSGASMARLLFVLFLVAYVVLLARSLRSVVFRTEYDRADSVYVTVLPIMAIVGAVLTFLRGTVSSYFHWYSMRTHSFRFAAVEVTIDEYSILCGIVGWCALMAVVVVVIPAYSLLKHDTSDGRSKALGDIEEP